MMGLEAVRLFFLKLFFTPSGKLLRLFGLAAPEASLKSAAAEDPAPPLEGVAAGLDWSAFERV